MLCGASSSSESDSEALAMMTTNVAMAVLASAVFVTHQRRIRKAHGGSSIGKAPNRDLCCSDGADALDRDYFKRSGGSPVFTDAEFERRYRM
jgi:hypothetical protein